MGFAETGERLWSEMSIVKRVNFLQALAKAIHRKPTWWGGLTPKDIARIPNFNDLPRDLRGRLIMNMTEERFSISEQARAQKIIYGMSSRP